MNFGVLYYYCLINGRDRLVPREIFTPPPPPKKTVYFVNTKLYLHTFVNVCNGEGHGDFRGVVRNCRLGLNRVTKIPKQQHWAEKTTETIT